MNEARAEGVIICTPPAGNLASKVLVVGSGVPFVSLPEPLVVLPVLFPLPVPVLLPEFCELPPLVLVLSLLSWLLWPVCVEASEVAVTCSRPHRCLAAAHPPCCPQSQAGSLSATMVAGNVGQAAAFSVEG